VGGGWFNIVRERGKTETKKMMEVTTKRMSLSCWVKVVILVTLIACAISAIATEGSSIMSCDGWTASCITYTSIGTNHTVRIHEEKYVVPIDTTSALQINAGIAKVCEPLFDGSIRTSCLECFPSKTKPEETTCYMLQSDTCVVRKIVFDYSNLPSNICDNLNFDIPSSVCQVSEAQPSCADAVCAPLGTSCPDNLQCQNITGRVVPGTAVRVTEPKSNCADYCVYETAQCLAQWPAECRPHLMASTTGILIYNVSADAVDGGYSIDAVDATTSTPVNVFLMAVTEVGGGGNEDNSHCTSDAAGRTWSSCRECQQLPNGEVACFTFDSSACTLDTEEIHISDVACNEYNHACFSDRECEHKHVNVSLGSCVDNTCYAVGLVCNGGCNSSSKEVHRVGTVIAGCCEGNSDCTYVSTSCEHDSEPYCDPITQRCSGIDMNYGVQECVAETLLGPNGYCAQECPTAEQAAQSGCMAFENYIAAVWDRITHNDIDPLLTASYVYGAPCLTLTNYSNTMCGECIARAFTLHAYHAGMAQAACVSVDSQVAYDGSGICYGHCQFAYDICEAACSRKVTDCQANCIIPYASDDQVNMCFNQCYQLSLTECACYSTYNLCEKSCAEGEADTDCTGPATRDSTTSCVDVCDESIPLYYATVPNVTQACMYSCLRSPYIGYDKIAICQVFCLALNNQIILDKNSFASSALNCTKYKNDFPDAEYKYFLCNSPTVPECIIRCLSYTSDVNYVFCKSICSVFGSSYTVEDSITHCGELFDTYLGSDTTATCLMANALACSSSNLTCAQRCALHKDTTPVCAAVCQAFISNLAYNNDMQCVQASIEPCYELCYQYDTNACYRSKVQWEEILAELEDLYAGPSGPRYVKYLLDTYYPDEDRLHCHFASLYVSAISPNNGFLACLAHLPCTHVYHVHEEDQEETCTGPVGYCENYEDRICVLNRTCAVHHNTAQTQFIVSNATAENSTTELLFMTSLPYDMLNAVTGYLPCETGCNLKFSAVSLHMAHGSYPTQECSDTIVFMDVQGHGVFNLALNHDPDAILPYMTATFNIATVRVSSPCIVPPSSILAGIHVGSLTISAVVWAIAPANRLLIFEPHITFTELCAENIPCGTPQPKCTDIPRICTHEDDRYECGCAEEGGCYCELCPNEDCNCHESCDDSNICTFDFCDRTTGVCGHHDTWGDSYCEETFSDLCHSAHCDSTVNTQNIIEACVLTPKICDDQNKCTDDYCDVTDGTCHHELIPYPIGNDTMRDEERRVKGKCASAHCDSTTAAWTLIDVAPQSDGFYCTVDTCDPATGETVYSNKTCTIDDYDQQQYLQMVLSCHIPVCNERDEQCDFMAMDCSDSDLCTDDMCDMGECVHPAKVCTSTDVCHEAKCNVTTGDCYLQDVICEQPENKCQYSVCETDFGCTVKDADCSCNYTSGLLLNGNVCKNCGCDNVTGCWTEDISCNDGHTCTLDTCDPVHGCQHVCEDEISIPSCDDENVCTLDYFDYNTWACVHVDIQCNSMNKCVVGHCFAAPDLTDGYACAYADMVVCEVPAGCISAACEPTTGECVCVQDELPPPPPPPPPQSESEDEEVVNCDDEDACTIDYYDVFGGSCKHINITCKTTNLCQTNGRCLADDIHGGYTCQFEEIVCVVEGCETTICVADTGSCECVKYIATCDSDNECGDGLICLDGFCAMAPPPECPELPPPPPPASSVHCNCDGHDSESDQSVHYDNSSAHSKPCDNDNSSQEDEGSEKHKGCGRAGGCVPDDDDDNGKECETHADCRDNDPCTADRCRGQHCVHIPRETMASFIPRVLRDKCHVYQCVAVNEDFMNKTGRYEMSRTNTKLWYNISIVPVEMVHVICHGQQTCNAVTGVITTPPPVADGTPCIGLQTEQSYTCRSGNCTLVIRADNVLGTAVDKLVTTGKLLWVIPVIAVASVAILVGIIGIIVGVISRANYRID
jgi:hypothetical protein